MDHAEYERQLKLEKRGVDEGVLRYRRQADGSDLSDLKPGQALMQRSLSRFAEAIKAEKAAVEQRMARSGRPSIYSKYFDDFDSDVLAFIAAKTIINALALSKPLTLNNLGITIGNRLEEQQTYSELSQLEPNLFNAMEKKANRWSGKRQKMAVVNTAVRVTKAKYSVTGLEWASSDKLGVGCKLIELFIEATGLCQVERVGASGVRHKKVVCPTPATVEWLEHMNGVCELLEPVYLPMIIPPVEWEQPIGGGYIGTQFSTSVPLIKVRNRNSLDEYFSTDMPEVYDGINAIQNTAWRINKPVYRVLKELSLSDSTLGGLVPSTPQPLPPVPDDMDTNPEALKAWKARAAEAHTTNHRNQSKKLALGQQLAIAELFLNEEAIYYPHNMDFRGRVYPVPTGLTPQSNDTGKAMLEFAEGVRIGENGGFWLAVHVANTYGYDKASLEDRVQWVLDNEEAILDSAMDPLDGQRFWSDADKPFCFLAACFEWMGFKWSGDDHISHLPSAMDGSCSGLQHYSALLKDEIGGTAVNLVPKEVPSDIYTTVSTMAEDRLDDSHLGKAWIGKVVRKIVKQPCMTYAYSATLRGMQGQVMDAMAKLSPDKPYIPGYQNWEAARYITPIILQCIKETVVAATAAMDWLKEVVSKLNKKQLPVIWETPTGMPVIQRSVKFKSTLVRIMFQGKTTRLAVASPQTAINAVAQKQGIAPNYIHSMDSAHLIKTVNACADTGVRSFAMVHDSFGTHAGNIDLLNYIIRDEFVSMYSKDWLQQFKADAERLLGEEVADPPETGSLDLASVLGSDFFFA